MIHLKTERKQCRQITRKYITATALYRRKKKTDIAVPTPDVRNDIPQRRQHRVAKKTVDSLNFILED